MATNVSMECTVFKEEYDENHKFPLNLSALHHSCLSGYQETPRNNFNLGSIYNNNSLTPPSSSYPSSPVQTLTRHISLPTHLKAAEVEEQETQPAETKTTGLISPHSGRLAKFVKESMVFHGENLAGCQQARTDIRNSLLAISDMKREIFQLNRSINEVIIPKLKEIEERNKRKVKYLEEREKALQGEQKTLESQIRNLHVSKGKLETASNFRQAGPTIDEAEEFYVVVNKKLYDIGESLSKDNCTRKALKKNAENIKCKLHDIQETLSNEEEGCKEVSDYEEIYHEVTSRYSYLDLCDLAFELPIKVDSLRKMTPQLRYQLNRGKVFAIHSCKQRPKYAQISLSEDGEVLLHHLSSRALPSDAKTIAYTDLIDHDKSDQQLLFLEFSSKAGQIGTVFIRLTSNSKRAQEFLCLMTGEKGDSYVNSRLLQVCNKGHERSEFLLFGTYENFNDGAGGNPMFPEHLHGTLEDENCDTVNCLAGVVGGVPANGNAKGEQFIIRMKDNPTMMCFPAFAKVEKGLDVLQKIVSNYQNVGEITIKDSGAVLELLLK